jgi:glycosyltransferase involved in cell wall biosynthesis
MERVIILLCSTGHGSGAERVLESLLTGATDRRQQISVASTPSSSVSSCARDLGYEWLPWNSDHDGVRQNLRAYFRFLRAHKRPGDLVHAWHTRHLEWALFLGKRWNVPSAGTIHDDPEPAHGHFGRARRWVVRNAAERLSGVVAVSSAIAQRCAELNWNCEPVVIRNGLPDVPLPRREPASALRLGFMAATVPWKGATLLPELVRRMGDSPVEWHLFGTPELETIPIVEELSSRPRVTFHGQTPLTEALRHIDVLLHLSLALDPYPTVLLEAARAGIPAIASTTGGAPEIVDDGRTGLLVPAGDISAIEVAIRRLLQNPGLREQMGATARGRYEREFRVAAMVAEYFAFWNGLRSPSP